MDALHQSDALHPTFLGLQAASESPAASLPTVSPRRVSRRDVDLGLPPAAPEGSPSPNSLPYQASPDHPDPMEEDGMTAAEEEAADEELSSEADTPEVGYSHTVVAETNKVPPQASVLATLVSHMVLMQNKCSPTITLYC